MERCERPRSVVCGSGPRGRKNGVPELPLPNVLVHFAVQGAPARRLAPGLDPRWIYLGCVLPDVAWIGRRALSGLGAPVDPIDLRLYAMVQASLFGSLILAAALALLSRRPGAVFAVLGVGALAHLLLDACEQKWGNGVHLLAPFDWTATRFDLFPNDGIVNLALTAAGALLLVRELRRRGTPPPLPAPPAPRVVAAALLGVAYLAAPLAFTRSVLDSNSYSVATLRARAERTGRRVGLERVRLQRGPAGPEIALWTGERVAAEGSLPAGSVRLSLEGRFTAPDRLRVERYAVQRFDRDWPSYAGLALLAALWLGPLLRARPGRAPTPS